MKLTHLKQQIQDQKKIVISKLIAVLELVSLDESRNIFGVVNKVLFIFIFIFFILFNGEKQL